MTQPRRKATRIPKAWVLWPAQRCVTVGQGSFLGQVVDVQPNQLVIKWLPGETLGGSVVVIWMSHLTCVGGNE